VLDPEPERKGLGGQAHPFVQQGGVEGARGVAWGEDDRRGGQLLAVWGGGLVCSFGGWLCVLGGYGGW